MRPTKYGGLHANLDVVANLGMAIARIIPSAAQCHMLHDGHMVTHPGSLSHHNACRIWPSSEPCNKTSAGCPAET